MSEISIINAALLVGTLVCLIVGLTFQLHKSHAVFMFSGFATISSVVNPIFFLNNQDVYAYEGWGAVKVFDFSFTELVKSYEGFYFVFSTIMIFSLIAIWGGGRLSQGKVSSAPSTHEVASRNDRTGDQYGYLLILCTALMAAYFPLYERGIGITGVPGELPFHLSGIVHYIRAYLVPIALAVLVYRASPSWKLVAIICIYALVAGIAAASRFVAILPIVLAIFHLVSSRKHWMAAVCILFCFFLWFAISASRDLTFDGERHALFTVIYYSLTNIPIENVVNELDLFSGRVSGAQQMVLVSQLHGNNECGHLIGFIFGAADICADTAGFVFGLDLSGTEYGVGLGLIPSIIISGDGLIDYVLPAIYVACLLWLSQFMYRKLVAKFNWQGIGILYLFLSVLFVYLGQLRFYYVLQFAFFTLLVCGSGFSRYFAYLPLPQKLKVRAGRSL